MMAPKRNDDYTMISESEETANTTKFTLDSPALNQAKANKIRFMGLQESFSTPSLQESGSAQGLSYGSTIFSTFRMTRDQQRVRKERTDSIIFPWSNGYKAWWAFIVFCSVCTIFFETYQIAFDPAGLYPFIEFSSIIEYGLVLVFVADIGVNFRLVYYNERDEAVYERNLIARNYLRSMFWIDLIGVFPFYSLVVLAFAGELEQNMAQHLALLRLFRLVRSYRVKQFFGILQYSPKISFMWLTLTRNMSAALVWTHLFACAMYAIARQSAFDEEESWIGGKVSGLSEHEKYVVSIYWSVVTFTTVGYGDFCPISPAEQIVGVIFMLLNIILQSWIIGSITLLIVKDDEKTGFYRETLEVLDQYSSIHSFDQSLQKQLKRQLKLDFGNREVSDEQVLKHFPSSVRQKVLRKLYLPSLLQTQLMRGVRQQFVNAFLNTCNVEIFGPGEDILQRGSIASDLYLLVEGSVKMLPLDNSTVEVVGQEVDDCGSLASNDLQLQNGMFEEKVEAGDFINEIGFFTESPQIDTVQSVSVCKTLTMSQSAYKMIAQDHPGSVGKILQNLLTKVEETAKESGFAPLVNLPKSIDFLRAGSVFDSSDIVSHSSVAQNQATLATVKDLVRMHMNKQKDDHTTRFLFAASRGDSSTISLMLNQGFDPNSADYDKRTALMVAAMKGNIESVTKLLEYHANPNLVDMHGSSALYEAAKNGHEATMDVLLEHHARLCMDESQAASVLCQAVFDGDTQLLKRLLMAQIQVNASDYDKRTAIHIAAAEGNVAALKVLVEFGADLTVRDRWDNSVRDEAYRVNAGQFLQCLEMLESIKT